VHTEGTGKASTTWSMRRLKHLCAEAKPEKLLGREIISIVSGLSHHEGTISKD